MEVITGKECQDIITSSLNKAYNAIRYTLGPKGANAIVKLNGNTIVTNDGVSILKELKLNGNENIPLKIIKEACFNAEKKSGDGTTTSIILTHAIYNQGISFDKNKVVLLKEIQNTCDFVTKIIKDISQPIRSFEDIENIATISSGGNKKLGKIISEAFQKVGFKGNVDFELAPEQENITIEHMKGLMIKADYLLKDEINLRPQRTNFLIYEGNIEKLSDLKNIAIYCREVINNEPLILISNFTKESLEGIFLYNNAGTKILPYSISVFGEDRLSLIHEAKFVTDTNTMSKNIPFIDYNIEDFKLAVGNSKNCIIKNNNILIKDIPEDKLNNLIEYRINRKSNKAIELQEGISTIRVGGKTRVEAEENLLRIEDAINSVRLALIDGIVIGGANLLANISNGLIPDTDGSKVVYSAMKEPLKTILENSGLDRNTKIDFEENSKEDLVFYTGFNAENLKTENLLNAGVIDPATTVINSLQSAVSIATALLNIKTIITEDD